MTSAKERQLLRWALDAAGIQTPDELEQYLLSRVGQLFPGPDGVMRRLEVVRRDPDGAYVFRLGLVLGAMPCSD